MLFQPRRPMNLESDEDLILSIRRHGIVLLARVLPPLLVLLVPVAFLMSGLSMMDSDPDLGQSTVQVATTALVILFIPLMAWILLGIYDWQNDSFYVTKKRVIRSAKYYFISQKLTEARLSEIQNVSILVPDMVATMLNYGTVVIETAAQEGRIVFDSIGYPTHVQKTILELCGIALPKEEEAPPGAPTGLGDILRIIFPFPPDYRAGGKVVVYHKHWFILLKAMLAPLLLLALVLAVAMFLENTLPLLLLIVVVPLLVFQYANWVNDIYILTDDRIIDIVRIPLIREDRREAFLERIQNVTSTVPDFLSTLLDMGDVFVETAGKAENFNFKTVHHPNEIRAELNKRLVDVRTGKQTAADQAQRQQIEDIVAQIIRTQYSSPPHDTTPPASEG